MVVLEFWGLGVWGSLPGGVGFWVRLRGVELLGLKVARDSGSLLDTRWG